MKSGTCIFYTNLGFYKVINFNWLLSYKTFFFCLSLFSPFLIPFVLQTTGFFFLFYIFIAKVLDFVPSLTNQQVGSSSYLHLEINDKRQQLVRDNDNDNDTDTNFGHHVFTASDFSSSSDPAATLKSRNERVPMLKWMKQPWECVTKEAKSGPTMHCHPCPCASSKSCIVIANKKKEEVRVKAAKEKPRAGKVSPSL